MNRVVPEPGARISQRENLEYLLDTAKDVGERNPRRQAFVKESAFLLYDVVTTHPFLNGDKRTALELVRLFLRSNDLRPSAKVKESYGFLLAIASGKLSETWVGFWVATRLSESKGKQMGMARKS